jgi:uncharacterized lipoprotein YddW (UPF0748 family)
MGKKFKLASLCACLAACIPAFGQTPNEVRGAWIYIDGGPSGFSSDPIQGPLDVRAFVDKLADTGFNLLLPWVSSIYMQSRTDTLVGKSRTKYQILDPYASWDSLGVLIDEAHKKGMQVHPWFGFTEGKDPRSPEFDPAVGGNVDWPARRVNEYLDPVNFPQQKFDACPWHPGEVQFEINLVDTILSRYPFATGIHIEEPGYRFPETECVCDYCLNLFRQNTGLDLAANITTKAAEDFRCQATTPFFSGLHADFTARATPPTLSVNGGYNSIDDRKVGRDWLKWNQLGYLNLFIPQIYNTDFLLFKGQTLRAVTDMSPLPVVAGVGVSWLHSDGTTQTNSIAMMLQQINAARTLGVRGVCLYYAQALTDDMLLQIKNGPFSIPAQYGLSGPGVNLPKKVDQRINFTALGNMRYGGASVQLKATTTSGLPVTFSTNAPASVVGTTLSVPANGTQSVIVTVTAAQPGDNTYNAAPSVLHSFTLIENTSPTTTIQVKPAPAGSWTRQPTRLIFSATDNALGAGVKNLHYRVNGGVDNVIAGNYGSMLLTADGKYSVTYYALDKAGNYETAHTQVVNLDSTAPALTSTPARATDANGWYTSPVQFTFGATDTAGSGISLPSVTGATTYSGPDSVSAWIFGNASDLAGNNVRQFTSLKFDATPPVISVSGIADAALVKQATFDVSASDGGSGSNLTLSVQITNGNGQAIYSNTVTGVAPDDGAHSLGKLDTTEDGAYHVSITCTDDSGNTSSKQINFTINQTYTDIQFQSPTDNGFYIADQTINYTIALGRGGTSSEQIFKYLVSGDQGPLAVSTGQLVSAEGKYVVQLRTINIVGSPSGARSLTFTIDKTPPITNDAVLAGVAGNAANWFSGPVTVGLSASDPAIRTAPTPIAGSGVAKVLYYATGAQTIGSAGSPTAITGNGGLVTISAVGTTTLTYWSVDVAGNASAPKTVNVQVASSGPVITQPADITVASAGTTGTVVNFPAPTVSDAADASPTIAFAPASGTLFPPGVSQVTLTATDSSGRVTSAVFNVTVTNPPPVISKITPTNQTALVTGVLVKVNGTGFTPSSAVYINGGGVPSTFDSITQLTAHPSDAFFASSRLLSITVVTPGPGGGTSNAMTLTVDGASQTVSLNPIPAHSYGEPPFTVSGSASSGLAITSFSRVIGRCTVSADGVVTLTGAGPLQVNGLQAGNNVYRPASNSVAVTIGVATPHLSILGATLDFDGKAHPATVNITGVGADVVGPVTIVYTPGGSTPPTNPGTYVAQASFAGNVNYAPVIAGTKITIFPQVTLTGVPLGSAFTRGGNSVAGSIALNETARAGGYAVTLSTSDSNVGTVSPTSVTIPEGTSRADFTVQTKAVPAVTNLTVTATHGAVSVTSNLEVRPPTLLKVTVLPATIIGPNPTTGSVAIDCPAPTAGSTVALSSSVPATVGVPASATVLAGASTASFNVTTVAVDASTPCTITATYLGLSKTSSITVSPPTMQSVVINPATSAGGNMVGLTVFVFGKAGPSGINVALSSTPAGLALPATVNIPAGTNQSSVLKFTTPTTTANQTYTVTATFNSTSKQASFTITPPVLTSITVTPTTVRGGTQISAVIRLSGPAPVDTQVTIGGNSAVVGGTFTVPAGSSAISKALNTNVVAANVVGAVTATIGTTTVSSTSITVTP